MHALKFGLLALVFAPFCAVLTLSSFEPSASSAESRAHRDARDPDGGTRQGGQKVLAAMHPPTQDVTDFKLTKTPPDPDPPMHERKQWIFDLRYDRGDIFFVGVHPLDLGAPQATPRMMGRFALELFEGPTLIERVRFDFPLLGAGDPVHAGYMDPPSFAPKLVTRIGVMFPATTHGNRLELWDRATNLRYPLPWPPETFPPASPPSAVSAPTPSATPPNAASAQPSAR